MEEINSKTKISTRSKIILGSIGALAFMVITAGGVLAATQTTDTQTTFLNRVAQIAGIDSQKLTDATKQAAKEQIDQRVTSGEITQAQADQMKQRIDEGNIPGFGFRGGFREKGMHGPGFMKPDFSGLANFLGLSESDLKQKMDGNTTLLDIAKAQRKSEDDLKNYLSQQMDQRLKDDVSSGRITQAQADEMSKNKSDFISRMISNTGHPGHRF